MVRTKKFIYAKRFKGMPEDSDFRLEEETLPPLKDGEILLEAIYLTVDPFLRPYSERLPVGTTMIGGQVAKIIESKRNGYPVGAHMYGSFGWRIHTIFNPDDAEEQLHMPYILPSFGDLPLSLGVGHLGKVSGAGGAVGSMVGQIAKIKGCKVIGITDNDEKCVWLTGDLGFDHAINYKTENVAKILQIYAPDGVDCYFDNVGGEQSSIVINQMRNFGRISACGAISAYNLSASEYPEVPILQPAFVYKQLTMTGFIITQFYDKWFEAMDQMKQWIDEGKLKYRETITEGFENTPRAFIGMLQGENFGKAVVKV